MGVLIGNVARKERRDTAANWTANDPTPLAGEWCLETDTMLMKVGDGSTAWTSLYYYDDYLGCGAGTFHAYAKYKDRTALRMFPFDYGNPVSQTTYARLYLEIGDMFEEQHIAAGDAASGAGNFYPTPIPGSYSRSAIPDSDAIDSTSGVANPLITLSTADYNHFKALRGDGCPVRLKIVTGLLPATLLEETTYYVRFKTTPDIELYDTEVNAYTVAGTTGREAPTDTIGTFVLTQEGFAIDDALEDHDHNLQAVVNIPGFAGGSGDVALTNQGGVSTGGSRVQGIATGSKSNETRPKTTFMYWYIKY